MKKQIITHAKRSLQGLALSTALTGLGLYSHIASAQDGNAGIANQAPKREHLVSIFARGEGKVPADSVIVSLTLRSEGKQLATAVNGSLTKKETLRKTLREAKIADKDIVFDNFSSDTETGKFTGKVRKFIVRSPIRVTIRDEKQFARISLAVDADEFLDYEGRSARV
ncbi:MAG: SIMPL domain-containing protein, partial [Verrucomicrobia bacterium]|nr:SIMPL domain-containing protein [Verrucomicrobiota bacterium]